MTAATRMQQRGLTFGGFAIGAFLLVLASIIGLKMIPVYMENAQIKSVFYAITHDPDMQNASPREFRVSFEKRASIDSITAIKANEIEIFSDGGNVVLSANYFVKIPLAGNVSLMLEFNPSSDK